MPGLRASFWQIELELGRLGRLEPDAPVLQTAHEYVIEGPSMSR